MLLYLSVTDNALSSVLVQEVDKIQRPVYFVRVLQGVEVRYQHIEKLAIALIITACRLRPYFQSYQMIVKIDQPIRQVLRKPDLVGRMVSWSIELSEFGIVYEPRRPIKAQALSDFIVELAPLLEPTVWEWTLSIGGASNIKGSGAGVILEGPDGMMLDQSLHFGFKASNNQSEYEALIAGMLLAKEMGITKLKVKSDSQLDTSQVNDTFQTKDQALMKYLDKVKAL